MPIIALSTQAVIWPTMNRLGELNFVPRTAWLQKIRLAHELVELGSTVRHNDSAAVSFHVQTLK